MNRGGGGRLRRAIGVLLVLVAALAVVQSYRVTEKQRRYVECQAEINAALIATLDDSRQTAAQERAATDAVYRALQHDPREVEVALNAYFARRAEADARRVANPLPEPPTRRC